MKKMINAVMVLAFFASSSMVVKATSASIDVKTGYFIVPAPSSPSLNMALQNVFAFVEEGWQTGYIETDPQNPTSLNRPNVWRVCQTIFGPSTMSLFDGTNNPTGNFVQEHGSRIGWIVDWNDSNPFLVSDLYFQLGSTESQNALWYRGNIATNTANSAPLTFSTTLRGELRDTNGVLIASYHGGEEISTHPVTRVIALIRVGYFVTDMEEVLQDLNYFKGHMAQTGNFASTAEFYKKDSDGDILFAVSDQMSSHHYLHNSPVWNGTNWAVRIEGQRQLGLTYSLERTFNLESDLVSWSEVNAGPEGIMIDPEDSGNNKALHPTAFYRVVETAPNPPVFNRSGITTSPQIRVINGPE